MAGTELQNKKLYFQNKGLVLKEDPAQLQDGNWQEITNLVSSQEGALSIRTGSQRLTGTSSWAFGQVSLCHSITKLHAGAVLGGTCFVFGTGVTRLTGGPFTQFAQGSTIFITGTPYTVQFVVDADHLIITGSAGSQPNANWTQAGTSADTRYFGEGESIWRYTGSLPTSGGNMTLTQVATGCADIAANYINQRFGSVSYNAGTVGTPYQLFACPKKMLKDTGTIVSGDGTGGATILQRWGILPPNIACYSLVDQITILPAAEVISGSGRINTSVSTATALGGSPGLVQIAPASMTEILQGMLVKIGSVLAVVQLATTTTFSVYLAAVPLVGTAITSGQTTATPTAVPGTTTQFTVAVPGAEFDGTPQDGYATQDVVHVSIGIGEPLKMSDIRLRVMVNDATGPDYYEKSILPSQLQNQASVTQTAAQVLPGYIENVNLSAYGPYDSINPDASGAQPEQVAPISPNQNPSTPSWFEVDVPKDQFLAVGNAGTGLYTWKNVVGFQIVSVSTSATTLWIGSIYIAGGFGPLAETQSASAPLLPYKYIYTYRNTVTGQESNPCVEQIENNWVYPQRQKVLVRGISTTDPQITSGTSSVVFYRAGGAFGDGLYRQVGSVPNVLSGGNPAAVLFYDAQSDESLLNAPTVSFDNDAPVTSTLAVPFTAKFVSYSGIGSGIANFPATINYTAITGSGTNLRPGSKMTIALNTSTQEDIILIAASSTQLLVYFQYSHPAGLIDTTAVFATCDAVAGQPCTLSTVAFDSVFLAGDPNNPQVLYKSKTGQVESFPVIEFDTGVSNQINVGSPSDPIMGLTEFNGSVVCLNLSHIFVIRVFAGQMQAPVQTPANRGLQGTFAWCKADNDIWYLGYDGIYSWSGGQSQKRSEDIDTMFHGIRVGNYYPIDMTQASKVTFAYHTNEILITYVGTDALYHRLRYDLIFNRWWVEDIFDAFSDTPTLPVAITASYNEPDSGLLLIAKTMQHSSTTWTTIALDDSGTSDGWVNAQDDGAAIAFSAAPAAYEMGMPSLQKQFADFILEFSNDGTPFVTQLYYDFSTSVGETFNFVAGSSQGRRRLPWPIQGGFGKEAYAMTMRFSGSATVPLKLFSTTLNWYPLDQIQAGRAFDWDDLGSPDDKRLYEMTVWYDAKASNQIYTLDVITGIVNNQVVTQAVQDFTFAPLTGVFTGPTWTQVTFPINDGIICKKIRLRPKSTTAPFIVRDYKFTNIEKLPPDIVYFSEWSNYGYEYLKYAQAVELNVDTGGVAATVRFYIDGAGSPAQTFTVTTNTADRQRNITLGPNLVGKMFRMTFTPGTNGKFQLWKQNIVFKQADLGPVTHTTDWDNMKYPYDKKLQEITFQYDNGSLGPVTMVMDTETGLKGGTINVAAYTFVLDASTRGLQTFAFPDGVYVKQVRLYPQADYITWRNWDYILKAENQPADVTLWTDYEDMGWPCEKIARNLLLNINTGGVACSIDVVADGAVMQTFSVTTTQQDRYRELPFNSNLIGKLWKLELAPGTNGYAQIYDARLDYVREPCAVNYYDSYESNLGTNLWKFLKQGRIHYQCPSTITLTFFRDGGQTFYSVVLPAHPTRDVYRFYYPAINGGALNKSVIYRIQMTSASSFKLYADSNIEFGVFGGDQMAAFQLVQAGAEQQMSVATPMIGNFLSGTGGGT